uniref:Uncharacterized protein n=1 Tax=Zea mays TaxID=4577 RepID=A0A804NRH1_MAIZE
MCLLVPRPINYFISRFEPPASESLARIDPETDKHVGGRSPSAATAPERDGGRTDTGGPSSLPATPPPCTGSSHTPTNGTTVHGPPGTGAVAAPSLQR